jgi:glycosyltransferase involved in cell wall biosynthesis
MVDDSSIRKKICIITYFFPPTGGGGVQRVLKFVKFLPKFGWKPILLIPKRVKYPLRDWSRVEDVPREVKIHKTSIIESELFSRLLIPDDKIGWLPFASIEGIRILKEVDVLYSTSFPFTAHLIAFLLKKLSGKPWVADFRDEWAKNPYIKYNLLKKVIAQWMEHSVLKNADRIIATTPFITTQLKHSLQDNGEERKFITITNGFDEEDFKDMQSQKNEKFVITYTGILYEESTFDSFIKAVSNIFNRGIRKIKVLYIGSSVELVKKIVRANRMERVVKVMGYIPHKDTLNYTINSDVLLLIIDPKRGRGAYTGKIFEYLYTKKPILALVPRDGVAAHLIRSSNSGVVVNPWDVNEIEQGLYKLIEHKEEIEPNWKVIEQFDYKFLSQRLASILDELVN